MRNVEKAQFLLQKWRENSGDSTQQVFREKMDLQPFLARDHELVVPKARPGVEVHHGTMGLVFGHIHWAYKVYEHIQGPRMSHIFPNPMGYRATLRFFGLTYVEMIHTYGENTIYPKSIICIFASTEEAPVDNQKPLEDLV